MFLQGTFDDCFADKEKCDVFFSNEIRSKAVVSSRDDCLFNLRDYADDFYDDDDDGCCSVGDDY